jgi:hypothetical protein
MLRPVFLGTVAAVCSFGLLTSPALAQSGQTQPQTPPPPAQQQTPPPSAQQPQPAPQAQPAQPAQSQFQTLPTQSFTAKSVHVDGLVGAMDIQVSSGPTMTYSISGEAEAIKTVTATVQGYVLVIYLKDPRSSSWFMWFEWNNDWDRNPIKINLTVPTGTPIDIDGIVGDVNIGDTNGPLKFEIAGADARVGAVTTAEIDAAGSGSIQIKSVQGALSLDVAGSGDVEVGSAGSINVDIAGSGSLKAGAIAGGLSVDIAGSGDVAIEWSCRLQLGWFGRCRYQERQSHALEDLHHGFGLVRLRRRSSRSDDLGRRLGRDQDQVLYRQTQHLRHQRSPHRKRLPRDRVGVKEFTAKCGKATRRARRGHCHRRALCAYLESLR